MKDLPSTRPYLIRAMHQWCEDNGFTAYLAVSVDASVRVPKQHVVDGEIVLNASMDATAALVLGNDYIEFQARFGGVSQSISIPVGRVHAIYARENGQGMAFPVDDRPSPDEDMPVEVLPEHAETAVPSPLSLVSHGSRDDVDESAAADTLDDPASVSLPSSKSPRPTLTRIK